MAKMSISAPLPETNSWHYQITMEATYVKRITRKILKVTTFALIVELITLSFFPVS